MKILRILGFIIILLICSCSCKSQCEGLVEFKRSFSFHEDNTALLKKSISYRIWYRDSISIQEVPLSIVPNDTVKNVQPVISISHFTFIDPKNRYYAYYNSFSDTAQLIKNYIGTDSFRYHGGWNFYSQNNFPYDSSVNLSDTLLNNITFSRIKFLRKSSSDFQSFVLYYRYGEKQLVGFMKNIAEKVGGTISRVDTFINNKLTTSVEIVTIKEKLSINESNIFDRWENQMKLIP